LRTFILTTTKTKAGHIKSSLGVTELTVALHYSYNTPHDILIWDVGHQAYVHKVLTERKKDFHTNRQFGGISGFTNRSESIYDPFGAGHSSTALSALSGFAEAARLKNLNRQHLAVVGDGAFTGGMHFEAMNFAGEQQLNLTLIINNNNASIDQNVGALQRLHTYKQLCEALGFAFLGEVDGHDTDALCQAFERAKTLEGPRAILVQTTKGKGYAPHTADESTSAAKGFQEVVGETLCNMAAVNDKVVVVSPAMLSGAGLSTFKRQFPTRCFDVGIAEQQAVTLSAALAAEGFRVYCHLYSTFAQRAYDQIIHDVALQNLPLTFLLDRAGLVGEDGATHHGAFDLSFLNPIPNLSISAASDVSSLQDLLKLSEEHGGPLAIRYPKGNSPLMSSDKVTFGRGRWLKKTGKKLLISIGALHQSQIQAIHASDVAHYDWVFLKPFNTKLALEIMNDFDQIITLEEGSAPGGLGQCFTSLLATRGLSKKITCLSLPDAFTPHGSDEDLLQSTGLDGASLRKILSP
jgi:1-deoxy-D-xylulose-5-phosphate synthase